MNRYPIPIIMIGILTAIALLAFGACVSRGSEPETYMPQTFVTLEDTLYVEGKTCVDGILLNTISDTLINDVQRLLATGDGGGRGGWEYIWVWHKEDGTSRWDQVSTIHTEGGDTSSTVSMTGTYEADIGISYDSVFQYRGGYASWYYPGSPTDTGYVVVWYTLQHDTTVLASGGQIQVDWDITVAGSGSILDTLEWHIAYGIQVGTCEEIDSMRLAYANGDTNVLIVTPIQDFTNDTTTFLAVDTQRSLANDTLKTVALMDEDGTILSNNTANAPIANPSTPTVYYKLAVSEN